MAQGTVCAVQKMDLSKTVLGGLHLAGDSTRISEPCYLKLVDVVFYNTLNNEEQRDVTDLSKTFSTDAAILKQAYAGLFTVVLEAAKIDLDSSSLSSVLEDKLSSERCSVFISRFERYKTKIRAQLSSISHTLPHVVDVDWRLDYCVKSDILEKINEPSYLITLKTEKSGEMTTEDVAFSCNSEQLQDLVSKLRDAVKCLERISQG